MTAEEMLEGIERAWLTSRANYRDSMLRIGRLLHEYILQGLQEGDQLGEDQRIEQGISRRRLVERAEERLKAPRGKVNELVCAAMGVELLWGDKPLEGMSYSCLRYLYLVIERGRLTKEVVHRRKGEVREGTRLPSDRERWQVRKGMEKEARQIFRTAIREAWTSDRFRQALVELRKGHGYEGKTCWNQIKEPALDWMGVARTADPKDLVEMLLQIIRNSRHPERVTSILRRALETCEVSV